MIPSRACTGYDFAIFGSLAENIGAAFFPSDCGPTDQADANSTTTMASTPSAFTTPASNSTAAISHVCVDHNLLEVYL